MKKYLFTILSFSLLFLGSNVGAVTNYTYTLTHNSNNSWTVTLNNPAYSVSTDPFYVPANYGITAVSVADLNTQNPVSYTHLTLPTILRV